MTECLRSLWYTTRNHVTTRHQHTVKQLGRSIAGFSQRGPAFSARAVRVESMENRHVTRTLGLPVSYHSTNSLFHIPSSITRGMNSGQLQGQNTQRHSLAPDENI